MRAAIHCRSVQREGTSDQQRAIEAGCPRIRDGAGGTPR
jgi:hypothetical protein